MDLVPVLQGVLPAIVAALLLVGLGGARLLALAAGVGLFAAYTLLKDWPALPTALWSAPNGTEWLLWAVAAACALALLERTGVLTGRPAAVAAVVLAPASVHLLLLKLASRWATGDVLLHVAVGGAGVAILVLGLRRMLRTARPGPLPAIVAAALLSVDAVLLAAHGSALLGQLCGALAAAVGAGLGTMLWRRPFALAGADGTWLGLGHGLFLLAGVHLANLTWTAAVLAAIAPLLLLPLVGRGRPTAA